MYFTCTQENLIKGLNQVTPIAGRNSQLPILQHVLLQVKDHVLHLTTTDLEVGVHTIIGGKMKESGSCALPARKFFDYIGQLPKAHPLTIERKGNVILVSTKGFQAQFPTADAEEFPLLPDVTIEKTITLDSGDFCQALTQTLFSASREEVRPEIRSVFVHTGDKQVRVAATDSYRLAERVVPYKGEEGFQFILPLATAQEVVRLFGGESEFHIIPHENHVVFQSDTMELTSRLIDGQYPDYRQIIPTQTKTKVVVDREELLRALKTLSVFLPKDSKRVQIAITPRKQLITLKVKGGEAGEGEVELATEIIDGEEMEALLNIQYLMDGVQHITTSHCAVLLNGADDPVVMKPEARQQDYVYLVMPIQV